MSKRHQIIIACTLILLLFTVNACAEMRISVPPSYGMTNSIVTLDCIVQCDEMDAANFYINFDSELVAFVGVSDNNTANVQAESGFEITTNVTDQNAVNKYGMIGVVIDDRSGSGNSGYFAEGVNLFTVQFRLLDDPSKGHQLQFAGDPLRKTSLMTHQTRGSWSTGENSGRIDSIYSSWPESQLNLPRGLKVIAEESFANCDSVQYLVLPDGLLSIEKRAFADNSLVMNIKMPASLQSIDASAFENCRNIVLSCFPGTVAHEYATEQRIPFILLTSPE